MKSATPRNDAGPPKSRKMFLVWLEYLRRHIKRTSGNQGESRAEQDYLTHRVSYGKTTARNTFKLSWCRRGGSEGGRAIHLHFLRIFHRNHRVSLPMAVRPPPHRHSGSVTFSGIRTVVVCCQLPSCPKRNKFAVKARADGQSEGRGHEEARTQTAAGA